MSNSTLPSRSQVYDSRAPELPMPGHIARAEELAAAAGFCYLSWNGFVFELKGGRASVNLQDPICASREIPGLWESYAR